MILSGPQERLLKRAAAGKRGTARVKGNSVRTAKSLDRLGLGNYNEGGGNWFASEGGHPHFAINDQGREIVGRMAL